jgi:hypothetical protein
VGFISLMIVGVAAKVVPTLNGVDVRALPALWAPFLLINTGCALRVVGQTGTDFFAGSFPFAGVSGLLEVAGLALWGAHLWSVMEAGAPARPENPGHASPGAAGPVTPGDRVGDVLDRYPHLLGTFLAFGFHPLANPRLRGMVAPYITVERACALLHVDVGSLLDALNAEREKSAEGRHTLPIVSVN